MNIAFDMSSFIWRGLLAGKDEEGEKVFFEDKEVLVNSAAYGYENVLGMMLSAMEDVGAVPIDVMLVFEGYNSKAKRLLIADHYKANRDSRPPQAYVEFEKLKGMLSDTFLGLGASSVTNDYCEGDDTLAYLAQEAEEPITIASYDGDMAVLAGVSKFGAQVQVWNEGKLDYNKAGVFDCKLLPVWKATVGDTSDNIKGSPGFGPAKFEEFRLKYGEDGMFELRDMLEAGSLDQLHAMTAGCKLIKKLVDTEDSVITSYRLGRLYPEWVNTRQSPLVIQAGMVKPKLRSTDERIAAWAGKKYLVTANNFDNAITWALPHLDASPFIALDIETSTPPESDEWLLAQDDVNGVDVMGSELTGISLTFGANTQHTMYFSVGHKDTANIDSERIRLLVAGLGKKLVIQRTQFELSVLFNAWGLKQMDNGYYGFLPNVLDTLIEGSYVNENMGLGLKERSKFYLGYDQVTYQDVTTKKGAVGTLPAGGRQIKEWSETPEGSDEPVLMESRQYKMAELTAKEAFDYGCDDTICTAALHIHYKRVMQLEHSWQAYLDVEIMAAYMTAKAFVDGANVSIQNLQAAAVKDDVTYAENWEILKNYLLKHEWPGSCAPVFTGELTGPDIKLAFSICNGRELETKVRTPGKLAVLVGLEDSLLAAIIDDAIITGDCSKLNAHVASKFTAGDMFNLGSPVQKKRLMYEVMNLPVRIRNPITDAARARGDTEGAASTDNLALDYAIINDGDAEVKAVLQALKLCSMVRTRRSLYYKPYPAFVHWKTGKIHATMNQSATNTRRYSSSKPNVQQLSKHEKIDGFLPAVRSVFVPHRPDAVVVSLDFAAQELRVIADYSQDPGMLSCFIGDSLKDMHSMTGSGIAARRHPEIEWSYETFVGILSDKTSEHHKQAKDCRVLGKKTNFTTEYMAAKSKVAQTLMVPEDEAQAYIDAKESAFPIATAWKQVVIAEAKEFGFVRTKCGVVRHLVEALYGSDKYAARKAERQAVNFKVQSSSAEQTKLAQGACWPVVNDPTLDIRFMFPVHDELVFSVPVSQLDSALPKIHAAMTRKYADMGVPAVSSISFGRNFFEQVEIGEAPTEEAISKGLAKLGLEGVAA